MNIEEQAKVIFFELEKVLNINYNMEIGYLNAIERGLRKMKETPAAGTARESD